MTTDESNKRSNIVEMAKKLRHVKIIEKLHKREPPTRAEVSELAKYEGDGQKPGIVDSLEKVAQVFGVSERTAARWKKERMPVMADGRYDIAEIQSWRFLREKEGKNGKNGGRTAKVNWEEKKAEYDARLREIKLKTAMGELVTIAEIEEGLIRVSTAIKQALLRLPTVLAARLENKGQREILIESTYLVHGIIDLIAQEHIFRRYGKKNEKSNRQQNHADHRAAGKAED